MSFEDDAPESTSPLTERASSGLSEAGAGIRNGLERQFAHQLDETIELMVASANRVAKAEGADAVDSIEVAAEVNVGVGSLTLNVCFDGQKLRSDETPSIDDTSLNEEASDVVW